MQLRGMLLMLFVTGSSIAVYMYVDGFINSPKQQ